MIKNIYDRLFNFFGPQYWWPVSEDNNADPRFEIIVGAILTQQTTWKNVEIAIKNLRKKNLLSPKTIHDLKNSELELLIRSSGYYKVKAKRLKNFIRFLFDNYDGKLNQFFKKPIKELRQELLSINGIGKETADSIILYVAEKLIFVVDAYTFRICKRLEIIDSKDYEQVRKLFENNLPKDINLFKEFHALIVELGKNYCKIKPRCDECPLKGECQYEVNNNNMPKG